MAKQKPIRWTLHALERVSRLSLSPEDARRAVIEPEYVVTGAHSRRILMRRYTEEGTGRPLLVRAIVDETPLETVVVTIYVTSKLDKYLKGVMA